MKQLLQLMPRGYEADLLQCEKEDLEEIRLRAGQPLVLRYAGREISLFPRLKQENIEAVLMSACRQSVYAYADTIRHGYVTLENGHRVGICGFGVMRNGEIQTIRTVSSLCIRIAKQVVGCADTLLPRITGSALLVGPPGSGKTTLLRDLVRQLSDVRGEYVCLADERSELSAGVFGAPQLQIGTRTDVLINIPKAEAAMMMLRTMSPQWIALDEITSAADISAMEQIVYCGVHVLATAHANDMDDLMKRPLYRNMMQSGFFEKIVFLEADKTFSVKEL